MKKWYERIIDAHVAVTTAVSHSERLDSDRYFVWQEDGAGSVTANNSQRSVNIIQFRYSLSFLNIFI